MISSRMHACTCRYIRHASPLHAARPEADVREVPLDLWVPRDAPPRFPEGSVVMARFGEHYHRGTVVKAGRQNGSVIYQIRFGTQGEWSSGERQSRREVDGLKQVLGL